MEGKKGERESAGVFWGRGARGDKSNSFRDLFKLLLLGAGQARVLRVKRGDSSLGDKRGGFWGKLRNRSCLSSQILKLGVKKPFGWTER